MAVDASMQTKLTFYEDPTRAKWTRGTYGTAIHERSKNVEAKKFEFVKLGKGKDWSASWSYIDF